MHYLYRITNQLNGKVYIGQSDKETERWRQHKYFAIKKPVQYIHRAMAKYGIENFTYEVIATCRTQEDTDELEKQLISWYDSRNKKNGYNIKPGGENWDDEFKKKMSDRMKEYWDQHPERKEDLSKQMVGNQYAEGMAPNQTSFKKDDLRSKTIASKPRKSVPKSQAWLDKMRQINGAKTFKRLSHTWFITDHSPKPARTIPNDVRDKIRQALLGEKHTEERRHNQSVAARKRRS